MKKELLEILALVIKAKERGIQGLNIEFGFLDDIRFTHWNNSVDGLKRLNSMHSYFDGELSAFESEECAPFKDFKSKLENYLKSL